jgi:DNA-binding response OmpR family regulator
MHVLIVEDNAPLAINIGEYLEQQGDEPDFASDGAFGLRLCAINRYDAIVLDFRLPKVGGMDFCRRLRANGHNPAPILMLIAHDTLDDRIQGLEAGADDYLTKPFSLRELHLRLRAIVRRRGEACQQLSAGDLHMDLEQRRVHCGAVPIELAPISFQILELLIRAFPGVVTRTQIEHVIWNDQPPESDAALRGHIHRLRQLLEASAGRRLIKTVHGIGYQLSLSS